MYYNNANEEALLSRYQGNLETSMNEVILYLI